jgi:hypothetical protein
MLLRFCIWKKKRQMRNLSPAFEKALPSKARKEGKSPFFSRF